MIFVIRGQLFCYSNLKLSIGFVIAAFSNREEPEVILREDILVGASSIFVSNSTAYIADHSGKLLILDISEIKDPVRITVAEDIG